jgi:hypothetical protein
MAESTSKDRNLGSVLNAFRHLMGSALLLLLGVGRELFALLNTSDEDNSGEISGGSLNYRTGERDDGTNPYGWYDHK